MYATTSVNERKEPSADSEKIGSLSTGEEVHVTGQTKDEQWYRIEISGIDEGFVASQYLSNDKPIIEQPEPETPAETTPAPETPSTSTSGSTTTAPNPGAQEVYDRVQSGQSSGDTNASRFANAVDGTGLISSNPGTGVLHAE